MVQQHNPGGGAGGRPPINVSVNRASVKSAEVTRMSIAGEERGEDTRILQEISGGISGTDSIKTKLDEVKRAIQDCCVAVKHPTGPKAKAAEDLNKAQEDLADQTDTQVERSKDLTEAIDKLHDSVRVLISQQTSLSVSSGDAAKNIESAGGAALASQKAQEAQYKALEKILFRTRKEGDKIIIGFAKTSKETITLKDRFSALRESLKEARVAEYVKTLNLGVQKLQNFQAELVDVQSQFRKFWRDAKSQYDEAANGLGTTMSLLTDELDNLRDRWYGINRDTERMVIEAIRATGQQQGALVMGRTLEDIGKFTRETRDAIQEDARLQTLFGYKGANEATVATFKLLTRRGIQDDIAMSQTQRLARQRLTMIANIAQNTGLTVEAVKKLEEKATESVENLIATGAVQGEQVDLARQVVTSAGVQGTHLEKMVTEFIKARGNLALLDKDMLKQLVALGGISEAQEAIRLLSEGGAQDTGRVVELLKSIGAEQKSSSILQSRSGGAILKALGVQEMQLGEQIREMQGARNITETALGKREKDPLRVAVDNLSQGLAKYLPSFTGLGIAIGANTIALAINTAALLGKGGGIGGMLRRLVGRGGAAAGAGAGAAGRAGAGAVARGIGGRALAGLGTAGAVVGAGLAGWEIGDLLNTAYEAGSKKIGWAGSLGSDIYSLIGKITGTEIHPDESITIADINRSRAERGLPPITPRATPTAPAPVRTAVPAPVAKPVRRSMEDQLDEVRAVLGRIADGMDLSNSYEKQIVDGILRITPSGGVAPGTEAMIVAQ